VERLVVVLGRFGVRPDHGPVYDQAVLVEVRLDGV
jgi:hypothetical protein